MMKKITLLCSIFLISICSKAQTPTWAKDIAPILFAKCAVCHHTDGIAPFSLITYNEAFNSKTAIKYSVDEGTMPPWPPDETYNPLAHARALSKEEKNKIISWVDGGAPQGNIADAPLPPTFTTNREIKVPDLELAMPVYAAQATNYDEYRCFAIPAGGNTDRFISQLEILPGNSEIVHHILVFYDTAKTCINLDDADPLPGYASFGGTGSSTSRLIGLWAPGGKAITFPQGFGSRLPKNATIVLQLHYPAGAVGKKDSSRVAFKFGASNLRDIGLSPILNHSNTLTNGPLFIAANTTKTFYSKFTIPADVTLLNIAPHMHLLGRNIKIYAVTPTNDTIKLVRINDWDFHWQGMYFFKKLIKLPKNTVVYGEAFYDNTTNNPYNPSMPPKDVSAGEATTEEMMLVYFSYAQYKAGDENIVIDNSPSPVTLTVTEHWKDPSMFCIEKAYPNPTENELKIDFTVPATGTLLWSITDVQGKIWMNDNYRAISTGGAAISINTSFLAVGNYFFVIQYQNERRTLQFIKQ